jgi:hypothetical protein
MEAGHHLHSLGHHFTLKERELCIQWPRGWEAHRTCLNLVMKRQMVAPPLNRTQAVYTQRITVPLQDLPVPNNYNNNYYYYYYYN